MTETLAFGELRRDWYVGNNNLLAQVKRHLSGEIQLVVTDWPAQWLPIWTYLSISWEGLSEPTRSIPIISDLPSDQWQELVFAANARGQIRLLCETVANLDPVITDFLYRLDGTRLLSSPSDEQHKAIITNWLSYGAPEVTELEKRCLEVPADRPTIVLFPCARKRPYSLSNTHKRCVQILKDLPECSEGYDSAVMTSLGYIPSQLWSHPLVMGYDSGCPDIYRLLTLGRCFFDQKNYVTAIDLTQFDAYADILRILHSENRIKNLVRPSGIRLSYRVRKFC